MDAEMRSKVIFLWRTLTYTTVCRLLMLFYVLVPFVLRFFPSIFIQTVFSNKYKGPAVYGRLSQPEKDWNFEKSTNQYILSLSGSMIGIWHIPPANAVSYSLDKADKIIMYCHGKAGNRASGHRIEFYEVLRNLGFHIVAFDYSGFGDSTGSPDGATVTLDTISVYKWVLEQNQRKDSKILIWGHSLGSAIVISSLAQVAEEKPYLPQPDGVVLESTFTNLFEASKHSTLFRLFDIMYPYVFRKMFKSSSKRNDMEFDALKDLPEISSHILMLHSEDDPKINVKLSQKVYDNLTFEPMSKVKSLQYYRFDSRFALGHNLVYTFPDLQRILISFLSLMDKKSIVEGKLKYEQFRL